MGLGEIQSLSIVDIPVFKITKQMFRGKRPVGPKIPGGLNIFVMNDIIDIIDTVPNPMKISFG